MFHNMNIKKLLITKHVLTRWLAMWWNTLQLLTNAEVLIQYTLFNTLPNNFNRIKIQTTNDLAIS